MGIWPSPVYLNAVYVSNSNIPLFYIRLLLLGNKFNIIIIEYPAFLFKY